MLQIYRFHDQKNNFGQHIKLTNYDCKWNESNLTNGIFLKIPFWENASIFTSWIVSRNNKINHLEECKSCATKVFKVNACQYGKGHEQERKKEKKKNANYKNFNEKELGKDMLHFVKK